jgi:hypothetical protein
MPALRATRTIMGRPDELFEYKGADFYNGSDDNVGLAFECMVNSCDNTAQENPGHYDSQHDIITISLPDKSLTRVINRAADGTLSFVGCQDNEYRVESDNKLNTITVTDPQGVIYTYGAPYEWQSSSQYSPGELRTAWALNSIELTNGRKICFSWSLLGHPHANQAIMGGDSFMDSWDAYQVNNTSYTEEDFINSSYLNANLSPFGNTYSFLTLESITFPLGQIDFTYKTVSFGPMLQSISVKNNSEVIKTANLEYNDDDVSSFLLTAVKMSGDEGVS